MLWDCFWSHLGQRQNHSSYMACGVLHPIFGCPHTQITRKTTGEVSSAWNSHLSTHIPSSQWCKQLRECSALVVWTAVMLLDQLQTVGYSKCTVRRPKGGFEQTPSNPPLPTGLIRREEINHVEEWGNSQAFMPMESNTACSKLSPSASFKSSAFEHLWCSVSQLSICNSRFQGTCLPVQVTGMRTSGGNCLAVQVNAPGIWAQG